MPDGAASPPHAAKAALFRAEAGRGSGYPWALGAPFVLHLAVALPLLGWVRRPDTPTIVAAVEVSPATQFAAPLPAPSSATEQPVTETTAAVAAPAAMPGGSVTLIVPVAFALR